MIIAIDFDGVIHDSGKLLPGVKNAVNILREKGHAIIIFSCNQPEYIKSFLENEDIRFDEITKQKPIAHVYIDDRGYRHRDWDTTLNALYEMGF